MPGPDTLIDQVFDLNVRAVIAACQAAIAYGGEQAIYDWNGVNQANANGNHKAVVPDLKICAGGQEKFKGFDLARADWPATAYSPGADGKYEYRYNATAPHRSLNWTFFLTRDGWNPATSPLRWSDLEQVQQLGPDQIVTSGKTIYTMKLSLPKRTGRHVLFSAWQHFELVNNGYKIERLRLEMAAEESFNRKVRLELEMQRRPQAVEAFAVKQLRMVAPTSADTLIIERTTASAPARSIIASNR